MKDSRKSFFYNPNWRFWISLNACCYIWCFKIISYVFPKLRAVLREYEYGSDSSAAIIGLISGTIFWVLLNILGYSKTSWNGEKIILDLILLPIIGVLGWLSLLRYRDYEIEKERFGKI